MSRPNPQPRPPTKPPSKPADTRPPTKPAGKPTRTMTPADYGRWLADQVTSPLPAHVVDNAARLVAAWLDDRANPMSAVRAG